MSSTLFKGQETSTHPASISHPFAARSLACRSHLLPHPPIFGSISAAGGAAAARTQRHAPQRHGQLAAFERHRLALAGRPHRIDIGRQHAGPLHAAVGALIDPIHRNFSSAGASRVAMASGLMGGSGGVGDEKIGSQPARPSSANATQNTPRVRAVQQVLLLRPFGLMARSPELVVGLHQLRQASPEQCRRARPERNVKTSLGRIYNRASNQTNGKRASSANGSGRHGAL